MNHLKIVFALFVLTFCQALIGLGQNLRSLDAAERIAYEQERYRVALPIALQAQKKISKKFGVESSKNAEWLARIGKNYFELGYFELSESCYVAAIEIDSVLLPRSSSALASHKSLLSRNFLVTGRTGKAFGLTREVLRLDSTAHNLGSVEFAHHLYAAAAVHHARGEYELSKEFYLCADSIFKKSMGPVNIYSAKIVNGIAKLFLDIGDFESSDSILTHGRQPILDACGPRSTTYGLYQLTMGHFAHSIGDYALVETYLQDAFRIFETNLERYHPTTLQALGSLASLYSQFNDIEQCKALIFEILQFPTDHPNDFATIRERCSSILAIAYLQEDKKDSAAWILKRLVEKSVRDSAEFNIPNLTNLNNYAEVLTFQEKYHEADSIYRRAIEISNALYRPDHPMTVHLLICLASLHYENKTYDVSDSIFRIAIEMIQKKPDENSGIYKTMLFNYFLLCGARHEWSYMAAIMKENVGRIREENIRTFFALSRAERENYWKFGESNPYVLFSGIGLFVPELSDVGCEAVIFQKNTLLRSERVLKNAIYDSDDSLLIDDYESWVSSCKGIMPSGVSEVEVDDSVDADEKRRLRTNTVYSKAKKMLAISSRDVASKLNKGQAAIELAEFRYSNEEGIHDDTQYGAYLFLAGDTIPKLIPLSMEEDVIAILSSVNITPTWSRAYYRGITPRNKASDSTSHKLYPPELFQAIWGPLDTLLEGVNEIFYSPICILNGISFSALPLGSGQVLGEKYRMHLLGTTGALAFERTPLYAHDLKKSALFGGMQYDLDDTAAFQNNLLAQAEAFRGASDSIVLENGLVVASWNPLPGTTTETHRIHELFLNTLHEDTLITGVAALEEAFKSLGHTKSQDSPSIVHIATHGYSNPEPQSPLQDEEDASEVGRFFYSVDPLLRSGLIFSGANKAWLGGEIADGREDGILTAAEIANIDLRDTKLVVLSACQSGSGDMNGAEGVFGLQRAFKLAGVELILATLWQVPDAETAEFMELFYTAFLNEGLEVRDAFLKAQKEMRLRYPGDPYLWGAFILLE